MNTFAYIPNSDKRQANATPSMHVREAPSFQFTDYRPEAIQLQQFYSIANNSPQAKRIAQLQAIADSYSSRTQPLIQKKENHTGLPYSLKTGLESLSGYSMEDVKVHYNSNKPAQLNAHAYAQGTDIHVASGKENYLAHEAWHVVQQKQGRVRPIMQLKGGLTANNSPLLEKEADVMGVKALQNKAITSTAIQQRSVGQIVQRVNDKSKRKETDVRMDQLKSEVVVILKVMKELGEDWEKKYGEKGKEKAVEKVKGVMSGEETDYSAEIRRAALKELWSNLSTEEKLEMASEAASLGGQALKAVISNGWDLISSSESSDSQKSAGSKSKKKEKEEPKRSKESSGSGISLGSVDFLSELTLDDLNTMYEVYKVRKRVLGEIAEAKAKIEQKAGEFGEEVGAAIGSLRDEVDFNKRMKARKQEFLVARTRYQLLEAAIKENDDLARYQEELDALNFAIMNVIHGPAMVYRGGDLNKVTRRKHPGICMDAILAINSSGPLLMRDDVAEMGGSLLRGIGAMLESSSAKEEKLQMAQSAMAEELNIVVNKSWSKFTSWGWTPNGVKKIRKDWPKDKTAEEKLNWAIGLARTASEKESNNRSPETQIFYDAISKLNVKDVSSLNRSKSIIPEIGALLG